jgi:hypothetical protein
LNMFANRVLIDIPRKEIKAMNANDEPC